MTAIRSTSLTLSAQRRAEPAICDVRVSAAELAQSGRELLAELDRLRQQESRLGALAGALLERRQYSFLELRSEPAHGADALGQRHLTQLLKRVDAELVNAAAARAWHRDRAGA